MGNSCEDFFGELFGTDAVVALTPPVPFVGGRLGEEDINESLDESYDSPRVAREREEGAKGEAYEPEETSYSTGAMYHARAFAPHLRLVTAWAITSSSSSLTPTEILTHPNGTKLFQKIRTPERAWGNFLIQTSFPGEPVEDWTIMVVMGGVLRDLLERRVREGVWRWSGAGWVGGRERRDEAKGQIWVRFWGGGVVVIGFVVWVRRRGRRGKGERLHTR